MTMPEFHQLVNEAKKEIQEIGPADLKKMQETRTRKWCSIVEAAAAQLWLPGCLGKWVSGMLFPWPRDIVGGSNRNERYPVPGTSSCEYKVRCIESLH